MDNGKISGKLSTFTAFKIDYSEILIKVYCANGSNGPI